MALDPTPLSPAPAPNSGATPSPSPSEGAGSEGGSQQNQAGPKPEGLPDDFWDPKAGLRTNELVKSYGELAQFRTEHERQFENFPEKAEDAGKFYTLPENLLPEDVKLPEGMELKPDEAMLGAVLPILHKHKASPVLFQELAQAVTAARVKDDIAFTEALGKESQKLGAKANERMTAVKDWITGHAGDGAAHILSNLFTAAQYEAFERLIEKVSKQSNVVPLTPKRDDVTPEPPPSGHAERMFGKTMRV